MIHLNKDTLKDLWDNNTEGSMPVLVTIKNPDIFWTDEEKKIYDQEDGSVNLISDNMKVFYKNKTWLPCTFHFNPPMKDGVKQGNASISLVAIDSKVVNLMRSLSLESEVKIIAIYCKENVKKEDGQIHITYRFLELNTFNMYMNSASLNGLDATFSLSFMKNLQQAIPYDLAVSNRVPGGTES